MDRHILAIRVLYLLGFRDLDLENFQSQKQITQIKSKVSEIIIAAVNNGEFSNDNINSAIKNLKIN